jgi:hypothetical protein
MTVHERYPAGQAVRYLVGIDTGGTYTDAAVLTPMTTASSPPPRR